jgi:hypothetical protein
VCMGALADVVGKPSNPSSTPSGSLSRFQREIRKNPDSQAVVSEGGSRIKHKGARPRAYSTSCKLSGRAGAYPALYVTLGFRWLPLVSFQVLTMTWPESTSESLWPMFTAPVGSQITPSRFQTPEVLLLPPVFKVMVGLPTLVSGAWMTSRSYQPRRLYSVSLGQYAPVRPARLGRRDQSGAGYRRIKLLPSLYFLSSRSL